MTDQQHTESGGTVNPPAFPQYFASQVAPGGMSLRDWFAGQALAGYLTHEDGWTAHLHVAARDCYELADAMLHQRAARHADGGEPLNAFRQARREAAGPDSRTRQEPTQ